MFSFPTHLRELTNKVQNNLRSTELDRVLQQPLLILSSMVLIIGICTVVVMMKSSTDLRERAAFDPYVSCTTNGGVCKSICSTTETNTGLCSAASDGPVCCIALINTPFPTSTPKVQLLTVTPTPSLTCSSDLNCFTTLGSGYTCNPFVHECVVSIPAVTNQPSPTPQLQVLQCYPYQVSTNVCLDPTYKTVAGGVACRTFDTDQIWNFSSLAECNDYRSHWVIPTTRICQPNSQRCNIADGGLFACDANGKETLVDPCLSGKCIGDVCAPYNSPVPTATPTVFCIANKTKCSGNVQSTCIGGNSEQTIWCEWGCAGSVCASPKPTPVVTHSLNCVPNVQVCHNGMVTFCDPVAGNIFIESCLGGICNGNQCAQVISPSPQRNQIQISCWSSPCSVASGVTSSDGTCPLGSFNSQPLCLAQLSSTLRISPSPQPVITTYSNPDTHKLPELQPLPTQIPAKHPLSITPAPSNFVAQATDQILHTVAVWIYSLFF